MSKPPYAVTMYWPSWDEIRNHERHALRPVVLWLPASDEPTFVTEARRQLTELQRAEQNEEAEVMDWIESHASELLERADEKRSKANSGPSPAEATS